MSALPPAWEYALLAGIGVVVSFVNSISGGGSILSLPLLMFLGLPAAEANGTNRIGIWMGSAGSVIGFRRKGYFDPKLTWQAGWPGLAGALAGSLTGVALPDAVFKPVLALVIAFVVFETVRSRRHPRRGTHEGRPNGDDGSGPALRSGFFPFMVYAGIGFYTGFIQAGVGLIMMYAFSRLGNLDLLRINSLKVSTTFLFISLSVLVYGFYGKIRWDMALALALGNGLGGFAGSLVQVRRGEGFIRAFLAISGSLLAAKLAYDAARALF